MPSSRAIGKRSRPKKNAGKRSSTLSGQRSARKKVITGGAKSVPVPVSHASINGNNAAVVSALPPLPANVPSAIVTRGDAGDHPGVQRFLQSVISGLTQEAFAASLEEPLYEPSDRIVARLGPRVVGHALVSRRDAYINSALVPVARLSQITILPELRGQGLGAKLLHAAETRIQEDQVPLALLATARPAFFEREHGWLPVANIRRTQLTSRNLVGILEASAGALSGRWRVRPWRQMEYGALEDVYRNSTQGIFAGYERTEAFWRWVVGSCSPARLLVAHDRNQSGDCELAGYVILRGESILEVTARNDRPDVLHALLHRACDEAIERSLHRLEFEAAEEHPAHRMLGYQPDNENGNGISITLLAKMFDQRGLLEALAPALDARAKAAEIDRPCELGFRMMNEAPCRLLFQPRSVKLANNGVGRSYLRCSPEAMLRTVLGRPKQGESLRFRPSTDRAKAIAAAIFPALPARYCGLEY